MPTGTHFTISTAGGSGCCILGQLDTCDLLPAAGDPGDQYFVGCQLVAWVPLVAEAAPAAPCGSPYLAFAGQGPYSNELMGFTSNLANSATQVFIVQRPTGASPCVGAVTLAIGTLSHTYDETLGPRSDSTWAPFLSYAGSRAAVTMADDSEIWVWVCPG